jgi:hypothetical protein
LVLRGLGVLRFLEKPLALNENLGRYRRNVHDVIDANENENEGGSGNRTDAGGEVTLLGIVSSLTGFIIAIVWLWLSFNHINVQTHPFYWIVQNLMGASVCIAFLNLVRLNSVKVGTYLLLAAFLYDIFFVFITIYVFGDSVMLTVAQGGNAAQGQDSSSMSQRLYCDRYVDDPRCYFTPLPMLFAVPRIADYRGGFSMLGLGDIVLPGLLCCFAARLDAAKPLVQSFQVRQRAVRQGFRNVRDYMPVPRSFFARLCSGYFSQIIIAYAMGLLAANFAVYLMKQGQPALMYIVPLTLCSLYARGKVKDQISSMWEGPKRLILADQITNELSIGGVERVDNNAVFRINQGLETDESFSSNESVEDYEDRDNESLASDIELIYRQQVV